MKTAMANFLNRFGDMGDNMSEIASPRWKEETASVWKFVKGHLSYQGESPEQTQLKVVEKRQEAKKTVKKYFSRGWRKLLPLQTICFSLLTVMAIRYAPYRQNTKFHLLKGITWQRQIALARGKMLQKQGYLRSPHDIFLLQDIEIEQALQGKQDKETILSTVLNRERQIQEWQRIVPPRHIYTAQGKIVRKVYENINKNSKQLKGLAASAGCVTGKARVILNLSDADQLQAGEILVTRFTDPSWTSLFSLASGVVMDIGSLLSHGAVVARELGIPAVVGVRCATELIENGHEITVDGSAGVVYLYEKS
jgi:pyruvate,water dikinase